MFKLEVQFHNKKNFRVDPFMAPGVQWTTFLPIMHAYKCTNLVSIWPEEAYMETCFVFFAEGGLVLFFFAEGGVWTIGKGMARAF